MDQPAPRQEPPRAEMRTLPVEQNLRPVSQQPLAPVAAAVPMASETFNPDQGGFTCLRTGFGSFPRVKVNRGKFEIDDTPAGHSMIVNIFDVRDMFVYRDRKGEDKNTRVVWSYDGVTTTSGESVASVQRQWEAEGFHEHNVRDYAEAIATIIECDDPSKIGDVVLLNIPPTSKKRMAGYQVVLQRTHGTHIPMVLTRITAEEIRSNGRNWDSYGFAYAGPLQQAA